jgi:hypothetical protein
LAATQAFIRKHELAQVKCKEERASQRINYFADFFTNELVDFAPGFSFIQQPQECPLNPDCALLLNIEIRQLPTCIALKALR